MRIEDALRAYLLLQSELIALIGQRIVPGDIDHNTALPCVVYQKISDVVDHVLTGQEKLNRPVFQFSAYAITKDGALDIAEQLETALSDYSGVMSGVHVQYIRLNNRYSSKETMADSTGRYYVEDLEFEVNYVKE